MADMISQVEGTLSGLETDRAELRTDLGLSLSVLISGYSASRLGSQIGERISLHTLFYLEGSAAGGNLLPRLAGFTSPAERSFFELFISVKGMGYRKALRSMALPPQQIAVAIADRDTGLLKSLPEIGTRLAENIVTDLRGKVDRFVSLGSFPDEQADEPATDADAPASKPRGKKGGKASAPPPRDASTAISREALEVLLQLGEQRTQAVAWINRALQSSDDRPADVSELLQRVYQIKGE